MFVAHCVSHIKGIAVKEALKAPGIMSPFRESVGCHHVNISAIPSIKYQALFAGRWRWEDGLGVGNGNGSWAWRALYPRLLVGWLQVPSVKPSNLQSLPFPFGMWIYEYIYVHTYMYVQYIVAWLKVCSSVSRHFKAATFTSMCYIKFKLFCCLVHWISPKHTHTHVQIRLQNKLN